MAVLGATHGSVTADCLNFSYASRYNIQALLRVWFRPNSTEWESIVHSSLSWSELNWCNLGSIPDAQFQATSWIMPLSFFLCVVFHVSNHWHCFWPCYSTLMKARRTSKGTESDLKMNSFLPNQQGYHSPLSQAPWIFLSDFHIVSASREERKLCNSEYLLEYFLLNKEEKKKKKKKKRVLQI